MHVQNERARMKVVRSLALNRVQQAEHAAEWHRWCRRRRRMRAGVDELVARLEDLVPSPSDLPTQLPDRVLSQACMEPSSTFYTTPPDSLDCLQPQGTHSVHSTHLVNMAHARLESWDGSKHAGGGRDSPSPRNPKQGNAECDNQAVAAATQPDPALSAHALGDMQISGGGSGGLSEDMNQYLSAVVSTYNHSSYGTRSTATSRIGPPNAPDMRLSEEHVSIQHAGASVAAAGNQERGKRSSTEGGHSGGRWVQVSAEHITRGRDSEGGATDAPVGALRTDRRSGVYNTAVPLVAQRTSSTSGTRTRTCMDHYTRGQHGGDAVGSGSPDALGGRCSTTIGVGRSASARAAMGSAMYGCSSPQRTEGTLVGTSLPSSGGISQCLEHPPSAPLSLIHI